MSSEITAAKLLQGSTNIDRMMHEIKHCVKLVLGYAAQLDAYSVSMPDLHFEVGSSSWTVGSALHKKDGLIAHCWLRTDYGQTLAFSTHEGEIPLKAVNVQAVHVSLASFIVGMLRSFPGLREKLQPLLNASQYQFA